METTGLELELAVLEARLEGWSVAKIAEVLGKSEAFVRKVLAKEGVRRELEANRVILDENLQDIRHRESQMREKASEVILDALNNEMGVDKKFDAAKVVYKTQKFESGVRDATAAFREVFTPKEGS